MKYFDVETLLYLAFGVLLPSLFPQLFLIIFGVLYLFLFFGLNQYDRMETRASADSVVGREYLDFLDILCPMGTASAVFVLLLGFGNGILVSLFAFVALLVIVHQLAV